MAWLNQILGWGTVALQAAALVFLPIWWREKGPGGSQVSAWLGRYAAVLAFSLALAGTVLSFIYSNWFGILPCSLCWYQRIFLYPQVIILYLISRRPTADLWRIVTIFSIIGLAIAILNYYVQWGGSSDLLACSVGGESLVSCQDKPFVILGYITIPMMSATTFLWLIILAALGQKRANFHLDQNAVA